MGAWRRRILCCSGCEPQYNLELLIDLILLTVGVIVARRKTASVTFILLFDSPKDAEKN